MAKHLILTGYGYWEYAVAGAAALRGCGGDCEVRCVSKRRLPEMMEKAGKEWRTIDILGVGLSGDVPRLGLALAALKRRGAAVRWFSSFPLAGDATVLGAYLTCIVDEDLTLSELVADRFSGGRNWTAPLMNPRKPSAFVKAYQELFEAAQYFRRNYQDDAACPAVIKMLAHEVQPAAWDADARRWVSHYRRYGSRSLVGDSVQIRTLQERINRVAAFPDARVLILGESGTGKETVAQQIHNKSPRRQEPFYSFNCASVNPDLLECRFFGHEKGAFTGADRQEPGLFELADKGTLFLDEIGELPYDAQGVLLRVLEGGRFMRLGGREEIKTDVRLITATNRDLARRVREGKFRADLYQRLNIVQIRVPPLREHKEDIRPIANGWWLNNCGCRLAETNIAALMEYDYPGNVRELINLLDRARVLGEKDFAALIREHREMNAGLWERGDAADVSSSLPENLQEATRAHVRTVYERHGRNLSRTAKALGVAPNTVRKHLAE